MSHYGINGVDCRIGGFLTFKRNKILVDAMEVKGNNFKIPRSNFFKFG
jgi:hypothetical protein